MLESAAGAMKALLCYNASAGLKMLVQLTLWKAKCLAGTQDPAPRRACAAFLSRVSCILGLAHSAPGETGHSGVWLVLPTLTPTHVLINSRTLIEPGCVWYDNFPYLSVAAKIRTWSQDLIF